jgi:hypothetical protein
MRGQRVLVIGSGPNGLTPPGEGSALLRAHTLPRRRPATTPGNWTPAKLICFFIGEVELAHTLPRVVECDANGCSLPVRDLSAGLVRDSNCLTRHACLLCAEKEHETLLGECRAGSLARAS